LAYLPPDGLGYQLDIKTDNRGSLAEFVKSKTFGQMFVSRTLPGVVRGNHYHHTKVEKFLVLEGSAIIRFRHVTTNHLLEYRINGREYRVVDIPPGYTHSIENIGDGELITLFWASEPFDINLPDTIMDAVLK
jgi:UDP-2-acetamido-2,6-beta-L-arabino-hexul-4-ose reductase